MSFKQAVEKISDNHYVLPKVGGMKVEAHAFLSAETGHPCLIPGSMYEGAAILFPLPGAHRSACSVNHGSGRLLARGEAKRKLEHKQQRIDEEMATVQRAHRLYPVANIKGAD